jgi:hypothetical protein
MLVHEMAVLHRGMMRAAIAPLFFGSVLAPGN